MNHIALRAAVRWMAGAAVVCAVLACAGLEQVEARRLTGGVVVLYEAVKGTAGADVRSRHDDAVGDSPDRGG